LESSESLLRLSVKAKQGATWPAVKGIYRKDEFIIFLDYKNKADGESPAFYILDSKAWKTLIIGVASENPKISIDDNNVLIYPDGWKGLNVKENMILNHKNKWEKILEKARVD
jgi:hypothetical protein